MGGISIVELAGEKVVGFYGGTQVYKNTLNAPTARDVY